MKYGATDVTHSQRAVYTGTGRTAKMNQDMHRGSRTKLHNLPLVREPEDASLLWTVGPAIPTWHDQHSLRVDEVAGGQIDEVERLEQKTVEVTSTDTADRTDIMRLPGDAWRLA